MTTSEVLEAPASQAVTAATTSEALFPNRSVDEVLEDLANRNSGRSSANQVPVQDVRIYSTHVEVEVKGIKKAISFVDFKALLDSQLQLETKMEMMALPYHCFMFSKSTREIQLACYYEERKMKLTHISKSYNAAMPNVIITHSLKQDGGFWIANNSFYFCTNKKVTELSETKLPVAGDPGIYPMPFPNFYHEGRMCYGGNTMPVKFGSNLRGLDYYYQVISVSPFNNDLGLRVRKYQDNIPGWFAHLDKIDKFDYTLL
jgi:hypothetical protein